MDVIRFAQAEGHGEAGIGAGGDGAALALAQTGPTALLRLGAGFHEVGELHDDEGQQGLTEQLAPGGNQRGEFLLVEDGAVGVGLALVPHGTGEGVGGEGREHTVVGCRCHILIVRGQSGLRWHLHAVVCEPFFGEGLHGAVGEDDLIGFLLDELRIEAAVDEAHGEDIVAFAQ